jgi:hypothetical protein
VCIIYSDKLIGVDPLVFKRLSGEKREYVPITRNEDEESRYKQAEHGVVQRSEVFKMGFNHSR